MSKGVWPPENVSLTPGKRVLFLTKNLDLIRKQLYEGLNLRMEDLSVEELLDDINTDVMTPAWVCFDHDPAMIAENAYAGLMQEGGRDFEPRALIDGGFEVIVSGHRKGTGSSRETAPQCERWSGIRIVIAASFAPIHERNNLNLGQLMGEHSMLIRLQNDESIPLSEFTKKYDPGSRLILENGGILPFARRLKEGTVDLPEFDTQERPMTMVEKLVSNKLLGKNGKKRFVKPGDAVLAQVDGGYSHEFTTAQVHTFLANEYGEDYNVPNPSKFAVFEDHLLYATGEGYAEPIPGAHRSPRLLGRGRCQPGYLPPSGQRGVHRRGGFHPGHRLSHMHGRRVQRASIWGRLYRVCESDSQSICICESPREYSLRVNWGA